MTGMVEGCQPHQPKIGPLPPIYRGHQCDAPWAPKIAAARLHEDLLHGTGVACQIHIERERARTLAHEDERSSVPPNPPAVVGCARIYRDFLRGTCDSEIIDAARTLTDAGTKTATVATTPRRRFCAESLNRRRRNNGDALGPRNKRPRRSTSNKEIFSLVSGSLKLDRVEVSDR